MLFVDTLFGSWLACYHLLWTRDRLRDNVSRLNWSDPEGRLSPDFLSAILGSFGGFRRLTTAAIAGDRRPMKKVVGS